MEGEKHLDLIRTRSARLNADISFFGPLRTRITPLAAVERADAKAV